jgi:hypothetical protein
LLSRIVTVGVAFVKKAPLPIAPPMASPTVLKAAVLVLELPSSPPWAWLSSSELLVTVSAPPSFQTAPPPPMPSRVVVSPRKPFGILTATPPVPPSAAWARLVVNSLWSMVSVPASL